MAARTIAGALVLSVVCGAAALAQKPTPQATQTPAPITIAGCVERMMVPGSKPGAEPHFRLIETAPATPAPPPGKKPPVAIERQYLLTAVPSIDLGKFQNQRVEVIGTVKPAPQPTPPATVPPDAPKSVFSVMQIKMISNECK